MASRVRKVLLSEVEGKLGLPLLHKQSICKELLQRLLAFRHIAANKRRTVAIMIQTPALKPILVQEMLQPPQNARIHLIELRLLPMASIHRLQLNY